MNGTNEALSEREIEIIRLVATGASNKEIAVALNISPNTVKVHLRNIFAKIGAVSRTEATLYAFKNNIVASPGLDVDSGSGLNSLADNILYSASPLANTNLNEQVMISATNKRFSNRNILLAIITLLIIGTFTGTFIITNQRNNLAKPSTVVIPSPPNRWNLSDPLPSARSGSSSLTLNGDIYVIGGQDGKETFSDNLKFDVAANNWMKDNNKPTRVSETQAAIIQEKIYIPGGMLSTGLPSNLLEVFDIQSNTWETLHPMPVALIGSGVAAVDGTLYVFGGWDGKDYSKDVYIYNVATNQWTQGTAIPSRKAYMATSVVEGHVLLIGGEDKTGPISEVLIYYPSQDQPGDSPYKIGPPLPQNRSKAASIQLANLVFLFGGSNESGTILPSLALDPGLEKWSIIDDPKEPIGENPSVTAVGSFIHVMGGRWQGISSASHQVYQAFYTITIPLITSNE